MRMDENSNPEWKQMLRGTSSGRKALEIIAELEALAKHWEDTCHAQAETCAAAESAANEYLRKNQRLNDLLLSFGDATTDMFEQMTKGSWIDEHGHDVWMNEKMLDLIPLVEELMAIRQADQQQGDL